MLNYPKIAVSSSTTTISATSHGSTERAVSKSYSHANGYPARKASDNSLGTAVCTSYTASTTDLPKRVVPTAAPKLRITSTNHQQQPEEPFFQAWKPPREQCVCKISGKDYYRGRCTYIGCPQVPFSSFSLSLYISCVLLIPSNVDRL